MSIEEIIKKSYFDPSTGYAGANKLYEKLKKEHKGITRKKIQEVLNKQEVVQLNKKEKSGSFVPNYPLHEFQIDLIYIENTFLNSARYALTCIDAFTKIAHVQLMKKRTEEDSVEAMEKTLKVMGIPEMIYCDEGSEFTSNEFKNLMKKNGIKLIFSLGHAPMVERFNRTLKEMIDKYLQSSNSKTIVNILPKIVSNYNNSYHSTIKMTPNAVNDDNVGEVWVNINEKATRVKRERLEVGDNVRVKLKPKSNEKKYKPKWSKAIHKIIEIKDNQYKVNGLNRWYLRANLMKITGSERYDVVADIEGTKEGHLKKLKESNQPVPFVPNDKFIRKQIQEKLDVDRDTGEVKTHRSVKPVNVVRRQPAEEKIIGKQINIYWPSVKKYFKGTVQSYDKEKEEHIIYYDVPEEDGNHEIYEKLIGKNKVRWKYV